MTFSALKPSSMSQQRSWRIHPPCSSVLNFWTISSIRYSLIRVMVIKWLSSDQRLNSFLEKQIPDLFMTLIGMKSLRSHEKTQPFGVIQTCKSARTSQKRFESNLCRLYYVPLTPSLGHETAEQLSESAKRCTTHTQATQRALRQYVLNSPLLSYRLPWY